MDADEIGLAVEEKFPDFFQKTKTKFRDYLEFITTFENTNYGSYFITKSLPFEIRNYAISVFENLNTIK
jgi:hypothetical protein